MLGEKDVVKINSYFSLHEGVLNMRLRNQFPVLCYMALPLADLQASLTAKFKDL